MAIVCSNPCIMSNKHPLQSASLFVFGCYINRIFPLM